MLNPAHWLTHSYVLVLCKDADENEDEDDEEDDDDSDDDEDDDDGSDVGNAESAPTTGSSFDRPWRHSVVHLGDYRVLCSCVCYTSMQ